MLRPANLWLLLAVVSSSLPTVTTASGPSKQSGGRVERRDWDEPNSGRFRERTRLQLGGPLLLQPSVKCASSEDGKDGHRCTAADVPGSAGAMVGEVVAGLSHRRAKRRAPSDPVGYFICPTEVVRAHRHLRALCYSRLEPVGVDQRADARGKDCKLLCTWRPAEVFASFRLPSLSLAV
jgi:hypothetical protein